MSNDHLGLGDNDLDDIDRAKREELRRRNPDNEPEVQIKRWTHALLKTNGKIDREVVFGCVVRCLTDDYQVDEIVCSHSIVYTPDHPGRRIYATQRLRFECLGVGNSITIEESDLEHYLADLTL
jgi:hypothetical protein